MWDTLPIADAFVGQPGDELVAGPFFTVVRPEDAYQVACFSTDDMDKFLETIRCFRFGLEK
jgi:hypothetical protein